MTRTPEQIDIDVRAANKRYFIVTVAFAIASTFVFTHGTKLDLGAKAVVAVAVVLILLFAHKKLSPFIPNADSFWCSLPSLSEYLVDHPECALAGGASCFKCGGQDIYLLHWPGIGHRRGSFCTSCNEFIYTSGDEQ